MTQQMHDSARVSLVGWLRKYQPAKIRLTLKDNTTRILERPQTRGKGFWTTLEKLIWKNDPIFVEALDEKDVVIASRDIEDITEDATSDRELAPAEDYVAQLGKVMGARDVQVAQIIADTTEQVAARMQLTYDTIVQRFIDFATIQMNRNVAVEQAYQALMLSRAAGAENGDEMARDFMKLALSGGKEPTKTNGTTNGAAEKKDDD